METESWEKAKDIFERAMKIDPHSRAQFLDEACAGDETIRVELNELLGSLDSAESFLESPVIAKKNNDLRAGQIIGRYEIIEKIGSGGMGEVFLATDTSLKRKAALKLLPAEFTTDKERLHRFEQEALAASALNHPNILTIYEIGESDGMNFIATEYIDGQTLRSLISAGDATFEKILDVAMQSVSALAAAHDVAIVHRDIKPENIMIRPDGIVKILDFGLAKSVAPETSDADALTKQLGKTQDGMIMGTVAYMSPEQARGLPVDTRTDIWSFGVVLYEMIAGTKPFRGDTASDTIASILKTDAEPLSAETPTELRRIVAKTLRHDRNERYQTAKDLLVDLKNLKQDLEFSQKFERKAVTLADGQRILISNETISDQAPNTRSISTKMRSPTPRWLVPVVSVAILILGMTGIGYYFLRNKPASVQPPEIVKIDSLAVLPFENVGPDTEYLSDGLTERLINGLSNLPDLRVISRDTVFAFKGKPESAKDIGKALNVRSVLTGKITQQGDSLVIQANLVDLQTDANMWGHRYDIQLTDVQHIEVTIAQDITGALQLKLSAQQKAQISKQYTENAEAYREYLKGRYYSLQYTPDSHKKALEHLNKAIDIDPTFAVAYAGIADAYTTASDTFLPPRDALFKAKAAAQKALDLDDQLAEAWAARGHARLHEWDRTAIDDLNRAVALTPRSLTNQLWLGEYYMIWDVPHSVEVLKNATELDPLSPLPHAFIGFDYYMLRQNDNAIASGKRTLELNPEFFSEYGYMAYCYISTGDLQAAEGSLNKIPPEAADGRTLSGWITLYAAQGKKKDAEAKLVELKKLSQKQYVSPFEFALAYVALNNVDETFINLNKAYDDHSEVLGFIRKMPEFDRLRGDPRYEELMRRIGFQQ